MKYKAVIRQKMKPDEEEVCDTAAIAWAWLMIERELFEDDVEPWRGLPEYSHVINAMRLARDGSSTLDKIENLWLAAAGEFSYAIKPDGTGHIVGDAKYLDDDENLVAATAIYSVIAVEE